MEPLTAIEPQPRETGWQGRLFLEFAPGSDKTAKTARTVLGRTRRSGPLTVQQPFYPEGPVCHLYLLHPPGGLVGGDCLDLSVDVHAHAHGLMTTPGATKFYRSNGKPAVSKQQFSLKTGAVFEWFPQETLLFEGAVARINTIIDLEPGGFFTGWEILCLGGPAIKKRFDTGALTSTLVVRQAGVPLLWERLGINGKEDLNASAGLRGCPVSAVFLSTGVTRTIFEELRCHIETTQHMLSGITLLDQLLVARYLGDSPEKAKDFFLCLWKRLRPLITGREACLPRIWNT